MSDQVILWIIGGLSGLWSIVITIVVGRVSFLAGKIDTLADKQTVLTERLGKKVDREWIDNTLSVKVDSIDKKISHLETTINLYLGANGSLNTTLKEMKRVMEGFSKSIHGDIDHEGLESKVRILEKIVGVNAEIKRETTTKS